MPCYARNPYRVSNGKGEFLANRTHAKPKNNAALPDKAENSLAPHFASVMLPTMFLRSTAYEGYKHQLGKALLRGLELMVAVDVVRTVTFEPQ